MRKASLLIFLATFLVVGNAFASPAEEAVNKGVEYGKKGKYDEAISEFTKAIELEPELAQLYYNRGNAYTKKGSYDEAILDYTRAVELKSDFTDAYNNRAVAYYYKKEYDKARGDVKKVEQLGGKCPSSFLEALKEASHGQ